MSMVNRVRAAAVLLGLLLLFAALPADAQTATAGQLLISEFRLRGPSGANDEFIEIYNNSGADHTVVAASGTGYGVAASDGTTRCSIPNGTVIPVDFYFVDTNGTSAGGGQRLGAPGPENQSSPLLHNSSIGTALLDTCVAASGFADLRPITSAALVVTVDRPPCGSGTSPVTVQGTTLEQPPSQPNGGGFNSSMGAGAVSLATPLAAGASLDLRFVMDVQQTGNFRIYLSIEAQRAP